jgi:uncharacterized protein (TIGR03118 family)
MSVRRISSGSSIERLENRSLMSASGFDQTNLVSDQFGVAQIQDKNLINPWGIALNPAGGAFWLADNDAGVATLFSGDLNNSSLAKQSLVVNIPNGEPTGVVANTTNDFVIKDNAGHSGVAKFIFASEGGNISGWNPAVPPPAPSTNAQPAVHVDGAFFTGLAIANAGGKHFLYAADFAGGKIDVFNSQFRHDSLGHTFTDPNMPSGFAPHNIENFGGRLFVAYAQQDPAHPGHEAFGAGAGFIDEYSSSGRLIQRISSGGALNAPWGMAMAPKGFGQFGGDLLVGNLGDGHITALDPNRNFAQVGQLKNADGSVIAIDGLWSLQFGNGVSSGDSNALYFTAGPDRYQHGLFGSLRTVRDITVTPIVQNQQAVLAVEGTGDADQLSITGDATADTTTVITDGRTQVFDHLFSEIDITMKGTHSHVTLDLPGQTTVVLNGN